MSTSESELSVAVEATTALPLPFELPAPYGWIRDEDAIEASLKFEGEGGKELYSLGCASGSFSIPGA